MTLVLVIVLIALAFGFVFAKLDGLAKVCRNLKQEIDEINNKVSVIIKEK